MPDFINDLNEAQKAAVINLEGPTMVLAGAGSGKTRVLTYRIAYLLYNGIDPFNILALTFTNKAAKEMRERIEKIIGMNARSLWMGTFHSIFARILRSESELIGFPYNFSIYDTIDAKSLIKGIIKEKGLDDKIYKPSVVYNRISNAKNRLIGPRAYLDNNAVQNEDKVMGKPEMGNIYFTYQQRLMKAGAMDFDDLLFKTNDLFDKSPATLNKYQNMFRYILVDEYQDTNFAQYTIIKKLAASYKNICVVGDDAQSIYSFRGANIENILNFRKDYSNTQIFKLEQNYRSTKNIVAAANSVISKNKDQIKKDVWTENDSGNRIKVIKTKTDNEEGRFVADSIFETKMNEQIQNSDFAILYRTNAQSRAMEEALRKKNIPYKIYGGLSFYQRKEIKDILAYFRLSINPNDEEAIKRVINYPARGIGKSTVDKIILAANKNNVGLWDVISDLENIETGLGNSPKSKVSDFAATILSFGSELFKKNAYELGNHICNHTGLLKDLYSDKTPEGISRYENIQELLNALKQFSALEDQPDPNAPERTLNKFMEEVALLTDADSEKDEDVNKVSLMTIHSAKGLEFPYVYIVGMEENLFPSQLSVNSRSDLEEERRLFYVALTRAEKKATLSYAQTRFKFGNITYAEPSRFIDEIPLDYLELPTRKQFGIGSGPSKPFIKSSSASKTISSSGIPPEGKRFVSMKNVAQSSSNSSNENIDVGKKVEHLRFGRGIVVALEGIGANKKATIEFDKHGKKQILLKFAKLKIVG